MPIHGGAFPPPPEAVRAARRTLRRQAPPLIARFLNHLTACPAIAPDRVDTAWALAALAREMAGALAAAQQTGGRPVVELVFALHRRLGHGVATPAPAPTIDLAPVLRGLAPYEAWLARLTADSPPWRAALMRWIDVLSERLTMHRYPDPYRRRQHAHALLGRPLELLAAPAVGAAEIDPVALALLRFWDLARARAYAGRGWNRLDSPADRLGGFYGLADEARPPTPEEIRSAAAALHAELNGEWPAWAEPLRADLQAATASYLESNRWPAWTTADRPAGLIQRMFGRAQE